jgi:hypothetical protein
MVKIMLLNESDAYNNEDWYINNFSFKSVKDADIDYKQITINSTSQEEIFKLIEQYVKPDENSILNITDLYYDANYVYQSIYKVVESSNSKNYNALGSQLTRTHTVGGTMILIKRCIVNNDHEYMRERERCLSEREGEMSAVRTASMCCTFTVRVCACLCYSSTGSALHATVRVCACLS